MPILANYNVKSQAQGATHANRDQGGAILLGEAITITVSPAQGFTSTGLVSPGPPGDFRAGQSHPCSVLGTGDNPDRLVLGPEAV